MQYEEFPISDFFSKITTSEQAINLLWRYKTADKEYSAQNVLISTTINTKRT